MEYLEVSDRLFMLFHIFNDILYLGKDSQDHIV